MPAERTPIKKKDLDALIKKNVGQLGSVWTFDISVYRDLDEHRCNWDAQRSPTSQRDLKPRVEESVEWKRASS